MFIAIALLEGAGKIDKTKLWMPVQELRDLAAELAGRYAMYSCASPHLARLEKQAIPA